MWESPGTAFDFVACTRRLPRRFAARNDSNSRSLVLLFFVGQSPKLVGVGSAARPTVVCMMFCLSGTLAPKGGMDMMIGCVLGAVELSRAVPGAEGKRFVQVRCGSKLLTALDALGVSPGELVLLTVGEGAARLCPEVPVDAAVLGVAGKNG